MFIYLFFAISILWISVDKAPEADLGDMDNVQLLTDNDDSTCVNVTNNTIQATWSEVFTSSWFLLVFDKKGRDLFNR